METGIESEGGLEGGELDSGGWNLAVSVSRLEERKARGTRDA